MPIYEFKCTNSNCNNIEEHFLRHSDPLPANCGKCASPIEKMVSQTSFSLKGSGWYVTDYKSSNQGQKSSETSDGSSAASSTASSSSGAAASSSTGSESSGTGGASSSAGSSTTSGAGSSSSGASSSGGQPSAST